MGMDLAERLTERRRMEGEMREMVEWRMGRGSEWVF